MNDTPENNKNGLSRRDYLKLSGLALGGLATVGASNRFGTRSPSTSVGDCFPSHYKDDRYSYFNNLKPITPWRLNARGQITGTKLDRNEMRITFLGSMIPPARRAALEMSVFVEVGWDEARKQPLDQFVFDCGSGVCGNYGAMGIGYARMDKVFLCHLHGDHMSDLTHIYCFGPAQGRFSPLYVFGPSDSQIDAKDPNGNPYPTYNDGTNAYCDWLRKAMRWHTESFSFQNTAYTNQRTAEQIQQDWGLPVPPVPAGDDAFGDGYALIPIELDWKKTGLDAEGNATNDNIAYWNKTTKVKITHFPVIHCRQGSIGYKLEWTNPDGQVLSMIYTSDTRPETISITHAINGGKGVDVFIHEMVVPPEVWAFKNMGLSAPPPETDPIYPTFVVGTQQAQMVQDSSHTPQGAFGYLLSLLEQANARPRLTVATHFPTADDTVACAYDSVLAHCPDLGKLGEKLTVSFDLMVLRVTAHSIQQLRGVPDNFGWSPNFGLSGGLNPPKYWKYDSATGQVVGDPTAQLDLSTLIPAQVVDEHGNVIQENYRTDGY